MDSTVFPWQLLLFVCEDVFIYHMDVKKMVKHLLTIYRAFSGLEAIMLRKLSRVSWTLIQLMTRSGKYLWYTQAF